MPLRTRLIVSAASAALLAAIIAVLSIGAPVFQGWLAGFVLSFVSIFLLITAWNWAGGGHKLAWMVALAFGLRLALGIGISFGLIAFGYQDEKVQHSGYLYADAFTRDNDAWDLAQSGSPIVSSFQQQIVSDQYGGALALSASIYRFLSPDAHRRFLILILTAFAAALGVPFFWKAVRQRFGDGVAALASWILVLYPESLLLGGSQLREPFLIGLGCIGFWAVFAWRSNRRGAVIGALASLLVMALFTWRVALVTAAFLAVCAWLEYLDDLPHRALKTIGWVGLGLAIGAAAYLSREWMFRAAYIDVVRSIHDSGWMSIIADQLGPDVFPSFLTIYGLAQPMLPAILVTNTAVIWKVIGIFRSLGWYTMAPVFLYGFFAAWKVKLGRDRRLLVGLALLSLIWIIISSARAAGTQWDDPRYRTTMLPWMAVLVAWAWQYARQTRDVALLRWFAAEAIFVGVFLYWYFSRYTALIPQIPFWEMTAFILIVVLLVLLVPWLWGVYRSARAQGEKFDPLARVRAFFVLVPEIPAVVVGADVIPANTGGLPLQDASRLTAPVTDEQAPAAGMNELSASRGVWPLQDASRPYAPTGDEQPSAAGTNELPASGGVLQSIPIPDKTPAARTMALKKSGINRWDWVASAAFLLFALIYFLGRLQENYPVVILSGDAGNIASYAAAQDHPDWFAGDPALGDSNNTGVYATIHIPLIRAIERLTGDYGLAYVWLLLPQTFLQLLGFYILGRVLFKNRFWAFLLAFLTAMMVINIGLGEIWGVWRDALPRTTFQALLPYLLALVVVWKDRPARWPWIMILAGLLVFVHPISAPAWGFAIWLSLCLLLPKDWGLGRKVLVMLGLGVLFLAALTPFALNYLSYQARGQSADYNTIMGILRAYNPANLFNIPAAFGEFARNMTIGLLIPLGLLGLVATWLLKKQDRLEVKLVVLWMAGIFITSLVVPYFEGIIEQQLHILPLETELLRGIRYFVPLLLIFWLWPLVELAPRLANPQARRSVFALGIVLFGFWAATNRPDVRQMGSAVLCLARGHLVCSTDRPVSDLITTLRTQTQTGEGVFFFNADPSGTSQSLSVRYSALRPLVYSPRDSGILGYANRPALPAWLAVTKQVEALQAMADPQARLAQLVPLAQSLKAHYLVIDFPVKPENFAGLPVQVMLQNEGFTLFKLP